MPALENPKHEHFCQAVANGVSATKAYTSAGYSKKGAQQSAARMLLNAVVCSRLAELRTVAADEAATIAAGTIALEISNRNARVRALQDRWARLRAGLDVILTERGEAMTEAPGGSSGLYSNDFKGKLDTPVYKIDPGIVALFGELRAHEKQAAEELGQWSEKRELNVDGAAALAAITVTFVRPSEAKPLPVTPE